MASDGTSSWQFSIAFGSLLFIAIGTVAAIFQIQLSAIKEQSQLQDSSLSARLDLIQRTNRESETRLSNELVRRENEIKAQLKVIQDELDRRRAEFVTQQEFKQFQAISKIVSEQVNRLDERLRQIEQNISRPTK